MHVGTKRALTPLVVEIKLTLGIHCLHGTSCVSLESELGTRCIASYSVCLTAHAMEGLAGFLSHLSLDIDMDVDKPMIVAFLPCKR